MAFMNAFQSGQMFALQQDRRQQELEEQAKRQQGLDALAEQYGIAAYAPEAFASFKSGDRADQRLASDIDQRAVTNARNEKLDTAALAEQQRVAKRQETLDAQAAQDRERQRKLAATGNIVRLYKAGLANGASAEEVTQRAMPALRALGVSEEEIAGLPGLITQNPEILDELEAALLTTDQEQARMRIDNERRRLDQGIVRLDQGQTRLNQGDRRLDQNEPEFQGNVAGSKKAEQLTAERVDTGLEQARQAQVALDNIDTQLKLMDSGIRTGSLAPARQAAARFFADILGIPDDEVAPTDEFFARAGVEVAQQIQAFGAGTGLSDADREFAGKIVGGVQTLDLQAIRRLIEMRKKVNEKTIRDYNKDRDAFVGKSERLGSIYPRISLRDQESSIDDLLNQYAPEGQ